MRVLSRFETMVESSDEPIQWAVSAKDNYELVIDLFYKLTGLAARDLSEYHAAV